MWTGLLATTRAFILYVTWKLNEGRGGGGAKNYTGTIPGPSSTVQLVQIQG